MLGRIRNNPIEMLNLEIGGVAVGIALQSSLQAELYVIPV